MELAARDTVTAAADDELDPAAAATVTCVHLTPQLRLAPHTFSTDLHTDSHLIRSALTSIQSITLLLYTSTRSAPLYTVTHLPL